MLHLTTPARGSLSPLIIGLYGRTRTKTVFAFILFNQFFLNTVSEIFFFFKKRSRSSRKTPFLPEQNKYIAADLPASSFLHARSFNNRPRLGQLAKFFLRCPTTQIFVESDARSDFGLTHPKGRSLLSSVPGWQWCPCRPLIATSSTRSVQRPSFWQSQARPPCTRTHFMPSSLESVTAARNGFVRHSQGSKQFPVQTTKDRNKITTVLDEFATHMEVFYLDGGKKTRWWRLKHYTTRENVPFTLTMYFWRIWKRNTMVSPRKKQKELHQTLVALYCLSPLFKHARKRGVRFSIRRTLWFLGVLRTYSFCLKLDRAIVCYFSRRGTRPRARWRPKNL